VDLAEVTPPWLAALPLSKRARVQFRSGCAAEQLPFADASFALVVSQWGLEYSDLNLSVPEILRVLAPQGRVQLLLHHVDALPVRLAAEEIEHLEWLTAADGFMERAAAMLGPMALAGTPEGRQQLMRDDRANLVREHFNTQLGLLETRVEQGHCVDVLLETRQSVNQLFGLAAQGGEIAAQAAWQDLNTGLRDAVLRLEELRRHSLDEGAAMELAQSFALGGTYRLVPMQDRGVIMGWALTVTPQR